MTCLCNVFMLAQAQIYVATDGDDGNPGTEDLPLLTIHKAVDIVQPGETIWVKGGTYYIEERIKIPAKETSVDRRICLWAVPGERVVIDASPMHHTTQSEFKMGRCIYVNHLANYWHFKGLTLCHAEDNGMKIEGSYNIVENCVFHDNNDTGLQIGMYKDFSIEETKELPAGSPQFNPGYRFCRGNVVINCDAYNNCDLRTYNGTDDGGDADGFACKLFPGPGTEFHGCRAWNNSDDNWDLYMVYHPVVIDGCWSYKAGYTPEDKAIGNGNGFKLGGGGSSGGAAFAQSVGAHVVTNCVAFDCLHKGFDQNNAYEGMYILNCTAWGNEYNYRFPTVFKYGGMYIRNCIGFNPGKLNHEFLSADKTGAVEPDTDYNSWTTLDGCNPYKEGQKVGNEKPKTKDYSDQFQSLAVADFMAPRGADGSLPDNGFARLVDGSVMIDRGEVISGFVPARFMTEEEAQAGGLELVTASSVTLPYNDAAPDFGAFETGVSTRATLVLYSGSPVQTVYRGSSIAPVTYCWGQAATGVEVLDLPETMTSEIDETARLVTIAGIAGEDARIIVRTMGGENVVADTVRITVSDLQPATLVCLTGNASQTVFFAAALEDIRFEMGGGATAFEVDGLPAGLLWNVDGQVLTISGYPEVSGTYTVTAVGGMEPVSMTGTISMKIPSHVLTGGWYPFQDPADDLPSDLADVISLVQGNDATHLSSIDPEKTESGSVPAGCTAGAVVMGRSGGGIQWHFPNGVIDLMVNLHFTGSRTFKIEWEKADGAAGSVTTGKLSKGTYCQWDVLSNAGLDSCGQAITIRLTNEATGGEVRMYDMYAEVYGEGPVVIESLEKRRGDAHPVIYMTETYLIVEGTDVASLALYDMNGCRMRGSFRSRLCNIAGLPSGMYILGIHKADGGVICKKITLK